MSTENQGCSIELIIIIVLLWLILCALSDIRHFIEPEKTQSDTPSELDTTIDDDSLENCNASDRRNK